MKEIIHTKYINIITAVLVAITLLSSAVQSGVLFKNASAETTTTSSASVTVAMVCSMTANIEEGDEHTATLVPGVYSGSYSVDGDTPYSDGIGKTTLTAICNDASGYAIYAVGYTGDTYGDNTLVGVASDETIATGTATSGNTSNWAMKITKVTDIAEAYNPANLTITNSFDSFHAVPDKYTKVASYSSATDMSLGSKVNTTYAAYIEPMQTTDTYVGKVKYTLVHPSTNDSLENYTVNFLANGGTGDAYSQTIPVGVATALQANTFTAPENEAFDHWNTKADDTGTTYTDGQSVTDIAFAGQSIDLYAQWVSSGNYLQDMDATKLNNLLPNVGDTTTLKDKRDEQEYTIGKLADGNYWLLDNLALDLTNSDVQAKMYNSTDTLTNASYATIGKLFNGGRVNSNDPTSAVSANWNSTYSYSDPRIYTAIKDTASNGWKYGVYYNYCAASAGSYCYGNGTSYGTSSGNATEDICPKGWKMPSGDTVDKSYYKLYNTGYSANRTNFVNAFHLPLSGYVNSGSPDGQGSVGYWWSSTRNNDNYMSGLYVNSSNVYPQNRNSRDYGFSMRCVWGS